jgi:hypothetical protein
MKMIVITGLVLFCFGCSTRVNYDYEGRIDYFSNPPINEVVEAYVGDNMLDQGKSITMEYLIIKQDVGGKSWQIQKGAYGRIGEHEGIPYFAPKTHEGIAINYANQPAVALHPKNKGELCVTTKAVNRQICYKSDFDIETRTARDRQELQQTLIYNGSFGNKINISYREFSNGFARSAFTNNVEYDMDKSKQINYKGAIIEVINFDNSSIKFKVIKHFRDDSTIEL